jgi:hypothetical protein
MKHQRKPNAWSCAITALAMTLDTPVSELIRELGHDGGEVIFPLLKEPQCWRGFHSQEIIRIAFKRGFAMTPIELFSSILATDHSKTHKVWGETYSRAFFMGVVNSTFGILEGHGTTCQHAVYNRYGTLYDPDPSGTVYPFSFQDCEAQGFYPSRLWVFTRWL